MFNQVLDAFNRLSLAARLVSVLVVVGVLGAAGYVFREAGWVLLIGVAVVGLALAAYALVIRRMDKRKESPMFKALMGNAAATPTGVSEPARRARLDDLRKNFEGGLEKFRSAGKSVYAVPWYVMVGEPGSGKTEMIRHSNIGFPPGLQDQLQGAGGTLNMHWWFTNSAVILDTAGRLMFEEVEPGSTGEWEEMLRQLRRNRPNCPINGMLLVIPAESLIKDPTEAIERKGGRIAQQLDSIQRTLGVRFPVFVVITKCDLINGFREFFDEINDPTLQNQMLGWSNPAGLDTPFQPELVEEHLKTVQGRLVRRRTGLLLDPINTEDAKARRTDQVDALYAFPDSLLKVGPRLKRYLEMIFVAGEWSQKPLFLRGIYFNSAMREGAALDAELADALGVPLDSLPEGRVWTKDRSFFIRDVMMSKVFRERGLVTRASNTSKLQRRRRNLVVGTAGAGLLALGLLTWLQYSTLTERIKAPSDFWASVSRAYAEEGASAATPVLKDEVFFRPIVFRTTDEPKWLYAGVNPVKGPDVPEGQRSLASFPLALRQRASDRVSIPAVFVLLAGEGDLLEARRHEAGRTVLEASVLRPLVNAADVRLGYQEPWTPEATGALAQLIRLEAAYLPQDSKSAPALVEVGPLLRYATLGNAEGRDKAEADAPALQDAVNWFFTSEGEGTWPPDSLKASHASTLRQAGDRFVKAWKDPSGLGGGAAGGPGGAAGFGRILKLLGALRDFGTTERALLDLKARLAARDASLDDVRRDWETKYIALDRAAKAIDALLGEAGPGGGGVLIDPASKAPRSLSRAFEDELAGFRKSARAEHDLLLEQLKPVTPDKDGKPAPAVHLAEQTKERDRARALAILQQTLSQSAADIATDSPEIIRIRTDAQQLDASHIASDTDAAFRLRMKMYAVADARVRAAAPSGELSPGATRDALRTLSTDLKADQTALTAPGHGRSPGESGSGALGQEATELTVAALDTAAAQQRGAAVKRFLDSVPDAPSLERLAGVVAGLTRERTPIALPFLDVKATFSDRYTPAVAGAVLGDHFAVANALAGAAQASPGSAAGAGAGVADRDTLAKRFQPSARAASEYLREYARYWSGGFLDSSALSGPPAWGEFLARVGEVGQAGTVNTQLDTVRKHVEEAAAVAVAFDRESLSAEDKREVDRLADATARAAKTLETAAWRGATAEVSARWKGLPIKAEEARLRVLHAWAAASLGDLLVVPANSDEGAQDFAKRYWLEYSRLVIGTLARAPGGSVVSSVQALVQRGFPLGTGKAEIAPADLGAVRGALESVRQAIEVVGAEPPAAARVGDTKIADDLKAMREKDAVKPEDRAALERVEQMLDLIERGDLTCKVTVLPNKAATGGGGAEPISGKLPQLALVKAGEPVQKFVDIYTGGIQPVGEMGHPSGPWEVVVGEFDKAPPMRGPAFRSGGAWGGLSLAANSGVTPVGAGQTFEIELPMDYNGGKYSLWLRLDFSKPLPPGWPWKSR